MLKKSRQKPTNDILMPVHFSPKTLLATSNNRYSPLNNSFKIISSQIHPSRRLYFIGNNFPGVYFTSREADCMALLLRGKGIKNAESDSNYRNGEWGYHQSRALSRNSSQFS